MEWVSTVANILHITNIDVYFIVYALVMSGIFMAIGVNRMYDCFFGLVAGISIFIVLQVLFFGYSNDLNSGAVMNPATAKFIVGSSVYLIFILSILTPINGIIQLGGGSKNTGIRILQTLFLAIFLTGFYTTIIIGLVEKSYIFRLDSAFSLMRSMGFWGQFASTSIIYKFLSTNITWVIISGIGYIIYKLVFGDMLSAMFATVLKALTTKKASAPSGGGGGGGGDKGGGGGGGEKKK